MNTHHPLFAASRGSPKFESNSTMVDARTKKQAPDQSVIRHTFGSTR